MSDTPAALLDRLLAHLAHNGSLTSPAIAGAFRAVPRHLFLPHLPLAEVYADEAIPIKLAGEQAISSSSQPSMMAIMLEQLALAPGQRVLEIGAGSGFNAALMGHLVGPHGQVVTVDIDEDLVEAARQHLAAAGAANVQVVCADGALGYPDLAPYDRIILTVGAWDIAPAWLSQLRPGGRLVLPLAVAGGTQHSLALEKPLAPTPGGPLLVSRSVRECAFMRLRGAFAGPETLTALGPQPGLQLGFNGPLPLPPEVIYGWLRGEGRDTLTELRVSRREVWQGLSFWLGLHEPALCMLVTGEALFRKGPVPPLVEWEGHRASSLNLGVLDPHGLSLLWLAPAGRLALDQDTAPRDVRARTFGPNQREAVAERLLGHLRAWEAANRPTSEGMQVEVYPADSLVASGPGQVVVRKPSTQLVIRWASSA